MKHEEFLKQVKERAEAATPGPYEARCKEFSNHAALEIWTEFGWLPELPRTYHEPTIEFQAACNPQAALKLLAIIEKLKSQRDSWILGRDAEWAVMTSSLREQANKELDEIVGRE